MVGLQMEGFAGNAKLLYGDVSTLLSIVLKLMRYLSDYEIIDKPSQSYEIYV